jgi:molybdenum cofactor synthesis domain-containing protein
MNQTVEIVSIGNELLIGKTMNTNAQWLAKRITYLGLSTCRITVVGDNINKISDVIKEAIQRNPRFLLTTGGLGPTFDDLTLHGLAKALGCILKVNEKALKMVKEKYLAYARERQIASVELTPHQIKMAMLPEGATPLPNPIGTAPAASIKYDKLTIIALPGVPSEMKSIFNNSVAPAIKRITLDVTFFAISIETKGIMESAIAPLLDNVMQNNPKVYIKSHPKGTEKVPIIEFHISSKAKTADAVRHHVDKALIQLTELIREKGGKIKPIKTET